VSLQTDTYRPTIESLESREMPAALQAYVTSGTLYVNDPGGYHTVHLADSGGKISITGLSIQVGSSYVSSVADSTLTRVVISDHVGGDVISISAGFSKPVQVQTMSGQDRILGAGNATYLSSSTFTWSYQPFNPNSPFTVSPQNDLIHQGSTPLCQTIAALEEEVKQGYNFAQNILNLGGSEYLVRLGGSLPSERIYFDGWSSSNDPTSSSGSFWAVLLQRARLKAYNINYQQYYSSGQWDSFNQQSGGRLYSIGQAIYDFTGASGTYYTINQANPQTLQTALTQKAYIVVATFPGSGKVSADGIIGNHVYAVLAVFSQNGKWYVRLYNPWGMDSTNGRTIDPLGPAVNDGIITVTWQQFTNPANFQNFYVAKHA
jgi:hypothetical protein